MISLEEWLALTAGARNVWLDGLQDQLPSWLTLVEANGALPTFEDTRHAQRFALIPDARVLIGVTRHRFDAILEALDRSPMQVFNADVASPARELSVPAHFASVHPMRFEQHEWVSRMAVPRLKQVLLDRAWRLPGELEWELHFRELHPRTPLPSLFEGELCADDWRLGYDTLVDAAPRGQGAELVRVASNDPDDVRSIVPARLPLRSVGGAYVRPVIDLPLGILSPPRP